MRILVTGHRGYIGANLVKYLAEHTSHQIHGFDPCIHVPEFNDSSKYVTEEWLSHPPLSYDCVVHLGAKISVEESVAHPQEYWNWNVRSTINLMDMVDTDHVIFASTAQVGIGDNPYTHTKEAVEKFLKDRLENYHIFRFFNVAGAGSFGQIGKGTHLIRIAAEVAAGKRDSMTINGTDYETPDGTCIRDYIHVMDLIPAIARGIEERNAGQVVAPLGTGEGFSVREVIDTMERVTGKDLGATEAARRVGDPAALICPLTDETHKYLQIKHTLEDMCLSAYEWELRK